MREDFIKVNGFNEGLVGWVLMIPELIQRLQQYWNPRKRLKNVGIAYHIYHKEQDKSHIHLNNAIEDEVREKKSLL